MISQVGGGQREERLAALVRGDGCDAPGAHAGLDRLCFAALQVGTAVGAPAAAVCGGAHVAGVGAVGAVRGTLAPFSVLFGMAAAAAGVARGAALLVCGFTGGSEGAHRGRSGRRATPFVRRQQLLLSVSGRAAAGDPGAGGGVMGRVGLVTRGRVPIGGNIAARQPETHFLIVAAAGGAAGKPFPTTLSTPFVVGFEAAFVLQGGALLCELQGGGRRSAVGLLVSLTAGGAQLGGRGIWFSNLGAGLSQEGQRTLLGIQLKQKADCD